MFFWLGYRTRKRTDNFQGEKTQKTDLSVNAKVDLLILLLASPKVQRAALLKWESCQHSQSGMRRRKLAFTLPHLRKLSACCNFDSCSGLPSHPVNSRVYQVKGNTINRKMVDNSTCPEGCIFLWNRNWEEFSTFLVSVRIACTFR